MLAVNLYPMILVINLYFVFVYCVLVNLSKKEFQKVTTDRHIRLLFVELLLRS